MSQLLSMGQRIARRRDVLPLLLLWAASLLITPAASASSSHYKHAACRLICRSDTARLAKKLCPCAFLRQQAALQQPTIGDLYLDDLVNGGELNTPYNSAVGKRWGLDMDMGAMGGDLGNLEWTADGFNQAEADDARKIFRFGKRGAEKKWSLEDDMSMALPWDMDAAGMSEEDRAGGKIFRFGKRDTAAASAGAKSKRAQ